MRCEGPRNRRMEVGGGGIDLLIGLEGTRVRHVSHFALRMHFVQRSVESELAWRGERALNYL